MVVAFAAVVLLLLTARPTAPLVYPSAAEWLPSAADRLNLRDNAHQREISELVAGLEAYDRRDLTAAIRALDHARASGATETMRVVFLGSALTQAGDYARAVRLLRSCPLQELPDPWRSETRWTLLVALHGAGETTSADSLLRALADQTGAVGARARRLLGRSDP